MSVGCSSQGDPQLPQSRPSTPAPQSSSNGSDELRLPLSPPDHILKRLTPLKRTNSRSVHDNNEETPRKRQAHKPRTLSADEVMDKVALLRIQNAEKIEKKKQELKEKLDAAERNRQEVIENRRKNAKKFTMNSAIWDSFKETFEDEIVSTNSNEDGSISASVVLENDNEDEDSDESTVFLEEAEWKALQERGSRLEKSSQKIILRRLQSYIYKKVRSRIRAHAFFASKSVSAGLSNYKTFEDVKDKLLLNNELRKDMKRLLELLGAPKLHPTTKLLTENVYMFAIALSWIKLSDDKSLSPEIILGPNAVQDYQGYNVPGFMEFHYYDDGFGLFIRNMYFVTSLRLVETLFKILEEENLPSEIDIIRLRFMKLSRQFLNLHFINAEGTDTRLMLHLFKINDNLTSSLAIQEHITETNDSNSPVLEIHVDELTKYLKDEKKLVIARIKTLKNRCANHAGAYNNEYSVHFTAGVKLRERRLQFYKEYQYVKFLILKKSGIVLPPGFSKNEWRRYHLELFYDQYNKEFDKLRFYNVPSKLRTGFRGRVPSRVIAPRQREDIEFIQTIVGQTNLSQLCQGVKHSLDSIDLSLVLMNQVVDLTKRMLEGFNMVLDPEVPRNIRQKLVRNLQFKFEEDGRVVFEPFVFFLRGTFDIMNHYYERQPLNEVTQPIKNYLRTVQYHSNRITTMTGIYRYILNFMDVWKLVMRDIGNTWIKESFIKLREQKLSYGDFEKVAFLHSIHKNNRLMEDEIRITRLDMNSTKIKLNRSFRSSYNNDSIEDNRTFQEKIVDYLVTKFTDVVQFDEDLELPLSFEVCKPTLYPILEKYRVVLQTMFLYSAINSYIDRVPLLVSGRESTDINPRVIKRLMKPDMNKLVEDINFYLRTNAVEPNFKLIEEDVDAIMRFIRRGVSDKIHNDSRLIHLFDHTRNPKEDLEHFININTTESSLRSLLKQHKYLPHSAKNFNELLLRSVQPTVNKAENIGDINDYCKGESCKIDMEDVIYKLKRLLDVNASLYKEFYQEVCLKVVER